MDALPAGATFVSASSGGVYNAVTNKVTWAVPMLNFNTEIIRQRPREMADFLRAAKGLTAEELGRLARYAKNPKEK